jgi:periplasmic protein TonB
MLTVSTKAFVSFCVIAGVAAASSAAVAASAPGNQPAHVDEAYPHNPPPYPDTAQTNGEQGSVILDVKVTSEGKVRNIKVDQSSGFADLDNAAIEGVLGWHFVPAMVDGETSTDWTKLTITYRLPTPPQPKPQRPSARSVY